MNELILDKCVEDIRTGRATIADCLAKYPEHADELRPLLETAWALQHLPDVRPSSAQKAKTRAMLATLSGPQKSSWLLFPLPRFSFGAAFALVLILIALPAVYASSGSLPGSSLYPIKRATEQVQTWLAIDSESQAKIQVDLAQNRLEEAKALSDQLDMKTLVDQAIGEYTGYVTAAGSVLPNDKKSSSITKELTDRLSQQQNQLRTLEKENKVSGPAAEKALNASEKAKQDLNTPKEPKNSKDPPGSKPMTSNPNPLQASPTVHLDNPAGPTRRASPAPTFVPTTLAATSVPTTAPNTRPSPGATLPVTKTETRTFPSYAA